MKKKKSFNIIKFFLVISIIIITVLLGFSFSAYQNIIDTTPIDKRIDDVRSNNNYVKIESINETFLNSIVAVEDRRFYNHGAIDIISIVRAFLINIKSGEIVEGGSTITQQLVKNLFLTPEQTLERKIDEILISHKIEKEYTKDEILELYVNVIYYGDDYIGIKSACNGYFSKEPNEITYDEATMLAGFPQAPNYYSLKSNNDEALERQKQVIDALNKWEDK